MKRNLGWLTLVMALAAPAAMAWAGEAKPGDAGGRPGQGAAANAGEPTCCPCCCHDKACPR
jgi:hypothetical protein